MKFKRQIIDIGLTFGRQIAVIVMGVVSLPLLARVLGPEGVGAYALILASCGIATTLGAGGVAPALMYFSGRQELSKSKISFGVWKLLGAGAAVSTLCVFLLTPFLLRSPILESLTWETYCFLFLSVALNLLLAPPVALAKCNKAFGFLSAIQILYRAANMLILAGLFVADCHSLRWLFALTILVNLCHVAVCWAHTIRMDKRSIRVQPIHEVGFRELANYSWKSASSNVVAQLNYRADVFLLTAWSTPVQLGFYGIAVLIAEKAWLLSQAVGEVSLSYLTQDQSSEEYMIEEALITAKWTGIGTAVLCLGITVCSPALPVFLGDDFEGAIIPVLLLTPGIFALGVSRILSNTLSALGKPELNLVFAIAGVVLNISLNAVLIPRWGALGAAIATSISYTFMFFLRLGYIKHRGFELSSIYKLNSKEILSISRKITSKFASITQGGDNR